MEDTNLYPNDGSPFALTIPDDQTKAVDTEEAEVIQSLPVIEKTIKHLEKRIAFYKSVDGISEDVLTNPEEFMHIVTANKIVVANLTSEKEILEELVKEYDK